DKGYDSQEILDAITAMEAVAVIPPRSNRKQQREYDKEIYKHRNGVERTFNKLKHWRRLATRYDRKACHYLSFVFLAAATLWM
ncbi:transposase, partial [Thalassospira sp. MBR-102]|uniref:transposase n=1 Tax=Thalassospira sp. MBR-102 TaxID=3156466 RepID=UPI003397D458